VLVGGAVATTAARQVAPDESISLAQPPRPYVSRGGEKLAAGLDAFGIVVTDRRALDAGASTGGFTDCLLRRGAATVHAVDVGRGQLAWSVRNDSRVVVMERTNIRNLQPAALRAPIDVAVADLSFISLLTVAPALCRCTTADADLVLLVKPQFEAGRSRVGKGGIVRDPAVHSAVLLEVTTGLERSGLPVVNAVASPLHGADGNREFLVHCRHVGTPMAQEDLEAIALTPVGAVQ
jgi:23S rRNA (cytidine1920-2'-O)/16S rRNA (cytidine1409-2'-O)-methyltransferase